MTLFFFWASIHVLHQIAYILECYERKQHGHLQRSAQSLITPWSLALYPLASYDLSHDEFYIGQTLLLYPEMVKTPIMCYTISGFLPSPCCFLLAKPLEKYSRGPCISKILLMVTTIGLAFFITSYSG